MGTGMGSRSHHPQRSALFLSQARGWVVTSSPLRQRQSPPEPNPCLLSREVGDVHLMKMMPKEFVFP